METNFTVTLTTRPGKDGPLSFINKLPAPLGNMRAFDVSLTACVLEPAPPMPVLVFVNIINAQIFNDQKMQVIGVYNNANGCVYSQYVGVTLDYIDQIKCGLTDMRQAPIPEYTQALITLHFKLKG